MSYTSKICSQIANAGCYASVLGGLGYLGARIVTQIDPKAALVCSAIAGAITAFFLDSRMNSFGKLAGLGILCYAPFKLCEMLKLPISVQTCMIITGLTTAATLFMLYFQKNNEYNRKLKKIDDFDHLEQQMKASVGKKLGAIKTDFEKKKGDEVIPKKVTVNSDKKLKTNKTDSEKKMDEARIHKKLLAEMMSKVKEKKVNPGH